MQPPLTLTQQGNKLDVAGNGEALEKCRRALEMAYGGKHAEAVEVLAPWWGGIGCEPRAPRLPPETVAELSLCAGVITCAVAPAHEAQRHGRRLLRRAERIFRSLGHGERSARCVKELAASLQRAGFFKHARRVAGVALRRKADLAIETEASLHLIVANSELSARRFGEALAVLERAYSLFENVTDSRIRGAFHNTLGLALKNAGIELKINDYLQRAIIEFTAAGYYFELADNLAFLARVENNIGFLLYALAEYAEAYPHIERARSLALEAGDLVMASYFEDTRARVLQGEGKLSEAECVIEGAICELERLGAVVELEVALQTRTEIKDGISALKSEASKVIPFPTSLTTLPARFVVSVSDDSLINVGIRLGDRIWICRRAKARDGELVFAVTPDGPTLAYYYTEGERVLLVYAGDDCPEREYPAALVRIYGAALNR
jgi:tetratricopeptide (TPR) repeat protein